MANQTNQTATIAGGARRGKAIYQVRHGATPMATTVVDIGARVEALAARWGAAYREARA